MFTLSICCSRSVLVNRGCSIPDSFTETEMVPGMKKAVRVSS